MRRFTAWVAVLVAARRPATRTTRNPTRVLALAAAIAAGAVLVSPPAAALGAPGDRLVRYQWLDSLPPNRIYTTAECFDRPGTFGARLRILQVDWNSDDRWDECFGISPNREIYHAWNNSAGWDPMPHNGRADDPTSAFLYLGRHRTITVLTTGKGYYCSTLIDNYWRPWAPCDPRGSDGYGP